MANGSWGGGKGSASRPIADRKKFEDNWDLIFKKKKDEEKPVDKPENK